MTTVAEAAQRRGVEPHAAECVSASASVGSNRWLGCRERNKQGLPAGAAHRAALG
ncbi:hypothetical protein [Caldilinea sp.]|uniref:hypothetical protein n=1 Tax=Caldilinea sp. TaxID=2293560 RepID=UPI00260AF84E|nr:hypothetical protein [uncultured Caldilinea sp.]